MSWKFRLSKFLFGGAVITAVGVAISGFWTFQHSLDAMQDASQENIAWSAGQLERELTRFRDSLGVSQAGQSNSVAEINQRFDVLWSRVAVFQRGKVGERLLAYDRAGTINRLFQELKRQETRVVSLSSFDFTSLSDIHHAFFPFSAELAELSRYVTVGEEQNAAVIRAQMRESANYALYASILTVFMVIAALVYFVIEGRRFRRLAKENLQLARKFEQASAVKSRFLTMMSHELRTPMNGVLGLLAVVRDTEMNPDQQGLLDQADRSAKRMLGMLTDILDFAALENVELALDNKPFFTSDLLSALPDLLSPVAQLAEARLHVASEGELPLTLRGDAARLRRSYRLMIAYFLETAGARDIELRLSYAQGRLLAKIEVEYLDGGWSPDLIFGNREDSKDSFATEVLGPSVARVLIAKMRGDIRLGETESGNILLEIEVPCEALEPRQLKVLLDTRSLPMEMICKSAVAAFPIEYILPASSAEAEIVMLESGATDEQELVSRMREASPSALVFGIGRPQNPALYDFVADVPLEAAQLHNRISEVLG